MRYTNWRILYFTLLHVTDMQTDGQTRTIANTALAQLSIARVKTKRLRRRIHCFFRKIIYEISVNSFCNSVTDTFLNSRMFGGSARFLSSRLMYWSRISSIVWRTCRFFSSARSIIFLCSLFCFATSMLHHHYHHQHHHSNHKYIHKLHTGASFRGAARSIYLFLIMIKSYTKYRYDINHKKHHTSRDTNGVNSIR